MLVVGVRNKRSIAYGIAASAKREGAEVVFAVEDNEATLQKAVRFIESDFPEPLVIPFDAASDESTRAMIKAAAAGGTLDGIVHAIAFAPRESIVGEFHEGITRDGFAQALDISAYSLTAIAKEALPYLNQQQGASIVTLSYIGAVRAISNYNLMGVAKAALEGSTRYLAQSMGPHNIRVNAISAGPIKTLAAAAIGGFNKILNHIRESAPLHRTTTTAEVGDAAAFLLSDLARGITGDVLYVDSGYHAVSGAIAPTTAESAGGDSGAN